MKDAQQRDVMGIGETQSQHNHTYLGVNVHNTFQQLVYAILTFSNHGIR